MITLYTLPSLYQVPYYGTYSKGLPVGDIRLLNRDRIVTSPINSILIPPQCKRTIHLSDVCGGVCMQTIQGIVGTR